MDLVELCVLLKTWYDEHSYNDWWLAQIHQQFPPAASDINELDNLTGVQLVYLGRKVTNNEAKALSIEYRTNLDDSLK